MADVINLNRARKAKNRAEKDKTAQANRIAHGTPKAVKKLSEARKKKSEENLKNHVLDSED
jgi:hypothetical protein